MFIFKFFKIIDHPNLHYFYHFYYFNHYFNYLLIYTIIEILMIYDFMIISFHFDY